MVERPGAVVRVEFWRGALLLNECAMAILFGGGSNNHPVNIPEAAFGSHFLYFLFEYF